ncbi:putative serine/threonine-protein kinase [Ziziphus jujuba]|uniref:Serine/threonine-protein kinase n=1 Tax=Ziziphus jujuba TaxID=326968 RepID=A0A6P3ZGE7_ZIZJJ|nr:putative serine/threonine-protein kinase [Ziziphus jujuba]
MTAIYKQLYYQLMFLVIYASSYIEFLCFSPIYYKQNFQFKILIIFENIIHNSNGTSTELKQINVWIKAVLFFKDCLKPPINIQKFQEIMKIGFVCSKCFSSSQGINISDNSFSGEAILLDVHAFSYNELKAATNNFSSSNKIGEGGFGSVYKGKLRDGSNVAVKVLSIQSTQGDKEFMSEIASLTNITHHNLLRLYGGCINGPSRILVYEYMENNSLSYILLGGEKIKSKFNWDVRRQICLGIACGLSYIHEDVKPHIVHRDIKPSNIVLDKDFNPKISDFGLSKLFPEDITHVTTRVAGTLGYLAPEYAISGRLTRKSDVYSFGVLLLEIVSGKSAIDFHLELGEFFLVEKAWEMYKEDKLVHLVDSKLQLKNLEEAVRFLKIGLLCVQEKCSLRPHMSMAYRMLSNEINIDCITVNQPALLTNIMDVKIARRGSSSHHHHHSKPSETRFLSFT